MKSRIWSQYPCLVGLLVIGVYAQWVQIVVINAFTTTTTIRTTTNNRYRLITESNHFSELESSPHSKTTSTLTKLHLFRRKKSNTSTSSSSTTKKKTPTTYKINTVPELNDYFNDTQHRFRAKNNKDKINYDDLLKSLSVKGDTQIIGSKFDKDFVHPVLQLLHERRRNKSPLTPVEETRDDGMKVALVVEGGGMRGCVTAGMVSAIYYLGLEDTFDVIYGSSAGTVIGAYFNTRQLPFFGPEIYYDALTTAGNKFIDKKRLLRCLGLGLFDPRLLKDVITSRSGKPLLDLDFLLKESMQENKKLDWDKFMEMQRVQPLKVVTSGLKSEEGIVLGIHNGGFDSLEEMARCMHASCLLPGIAGPAMNIITKQSDNQDDSKQYSNAKIQKGNNIQIKDGQVEPLADALLFEPLAYSKAIEEGATHVVVLRSRPDGTDVTGKSSIFERLIFRRFFLRKNKLRNMYKYIRQYSHKKAYAKQVLELNHGAKSTAKYDDCSESHLFPIAIEPGSPEVARLETGREAIFEGVRRGFARAYDALVEDVEERGRGKEVALQFFPDEILDYDPLEIIDAEGSSAFSHFMKLQAEKGDDSYVKAASSLHWGKTASEANLPR